jgi:hypothetical protein
VHTWHHKIFLAVNQLHLDPVGFGITNFGSSKISAYYNAGNNIAAAVASMQGALYKSLLRLTLLRVIGKPVNI